MTRDDIIRMAIEAGLHDEMWFGPHTPTNYEDCLPKIERFANLVAASEREACAALCDKISDDDGFEGGYADNCAKAIRARGSITYTAPPQREWQGLTHEEIMNLVHDVRGQNMVVTTDYLARAIEAKLKEKNT